MSPCTSTAISRDLYSAAKEVEVAAEKVRARGGPDDSPRGTADHAEGAEAVGELVRGSAGQEDGVRQKERNLFPHLDFGANFKFFVLCRKLIDSWRKRGRNRSLEESKPPEVVWRSNSEDNISVVGRKPHQSEKKVRIKVG